jgi:hypothetical protein
MHAGLANVAGRDSRDRAAGGGQRDGVLLPGRLGSGDRPNSAIYSLSD